MSIQQPKRSKASMALDLIDKAIINGEAEKVYDYLGKINLENYQRTNRMFYLKDSASQP